MIRFLHTSDWQLGLTRYFFSEGAQERYNQARFDAIRSLGKIAVAERCQFIAVCGDVFESNQVEQKTVVRAIEALKDVAVPVYILPGNHDPLNEVSVYRSGTFVNGKPSHVKVIESSVPIQIDDGVEIVGAPWLSKRMAVNPFNEAIAVKNPSANTIRIILAHGIVDLFTPKKDDPGVIASESLQEAINNKLAAFIALGDRHTLTRVGSGDCVWYSGTPEVTDFGQDGAGQALVVELDGNHVVVKPVNVGQWKFIERDHIDVNTNDDIEALSRTLEGVDHKEQTAIKLKLVGSVSLSQETILQKSLEIAGQLFGSLQLMNDDLAILADDADFSGLGFSGFAEETVKRLRERMPVEGGKKISARDALMLLVRLAGGGA